MSSAVTAQWVARLCSGVSSVCSADAPTLNVMLREAGHLLGFGLLGLLCMQRWRPVLPQRSASSHRVALVAGALGIISALVAGALDEAHQLPLAHRSASLNDVLLDTAGAVLLIGASLAWDRWQRSKRTGPANAHCATALVASEDLIHHAL